MKQTKRRSKAMTILLLPMIAVLFIVGGILYVLGDQPTRRIKKKQIHQRTEKEEVLLWAGK